MIATKTETGIKYTAEHWYEWFVVEVSKSLMRFPEDGDIIPRFYLPINYIPRLGCYRCWVFPLAPFAIIYLIISRMLIGVWKDLMELAEILKIKYENRKN